MKKNFAIILSIVVLIHIMTLPSHANEYDTDYSATPSSEELLSVLKSETDENIVKTYYDDFDNDGNYEMFAIAGDVTNGDEFYSATVVGKVWFVANGKAKAISSSKGFGIMLDDKTSPKVINMGEKRALLFHCTWGNYSIKSTLCYVKNGEAIVLSFDGYFSYTDDGFIAENDTYDCIIKKADFNSGKYAGTGRTWKDYWYYFDENNMSMMEYGAITISPEQFLEFDASSEILETITAGTVYNILYRANGIININIIEDIGDEYKASNLTVRYNGTDVQLIEQNEGVYLAALSAAKATYPVFQSPSALKQNESSNSIIAENKQYADYSIERDDASWYDANGELKLLQYFDKIVLEPADDNYKRINKLIQQESDKFLSEADEIISYTKENPFDGWYSNCSDAVVTTNDNGILSIKTSYIWFMGGITVDYGDSGLNYNLNTGNILSLTDVFSLSAFEIEQYLKEQTKKYILNNPGNGWWSDAVSTVEEYTLEQFNYYIENNNIYLCYPKYELGPGGMGPITVCCPIIKPNKNITIVLNGQELSLDQPPIIKDNRTLVPLRAIFESLGADVNWDNATQTVTSVKGPTTVTIQIGDYKLIKNGAISILDVPAQIIGGRTFVPVRAVAEAFGAEVKWDGNSNIVYIDTSAKINAL